ncbi:MAG: hypothetical protein ACRCZY_11485 [Phocaeicola sp.]
MMKRIATIVLGMVVLLVAVQPKLVVHFCGDNFVALYLNQDPSAIASACGGSSKRNGPVPREIDNFSVYSKEESQTKDADHTVDQGINQYIEHAASQARACATNHLTNRLESDRAPQHKEHTAGDQLRVDSLQEEGCPMRQLTVVDVAADDFLSLQPYAHSFSLNWEAVTLFASVVIHDLLPQQDVAHLLCGKAPPYLLIPLTGRDILLRHATFLI